MAELSGRHTRTLSAVFASPTRRNIRWGDIESLIRALGAEVDEGEGSRVSFTLNGVTVVFHRPHPRPEARVKTVVSVQKFLRSAGIEP